MIAEQSILDTSVVVAIGRGETPEIPAQNAISTVTLCELHHGALVATEAQLPDRLALLTMVERTFEALPVDSRVAPVFGFVMAETRRRGRGRPRVADALIAATAMSHGLPLYTRDRDFERMPIPELVIV